MPTCSACGSPVADGTQICPACGARISGAAPPTLPAPLGTPGASPAGPAVAPPPLVAPAPAPASLGDRALAIALDTLVPLAALVMLAIWLGPRFGTTTAEGFSFEGWPAVVLASVALLVALAYQTCLEWWFGTTLGKLVAGARVVGRNGGRPDARAALVRNLLRFVDGLGLYLVGAFAFLLTKQRQRVGDLVAGTTVVRDEPSTFARVVALVALVALPASSFALLVSRASGAGGAATTATGTPDTGGTRTPVTPEEAAAGVLRIANARLAAGKSGPDRPDGVFKPGETPTLTFDVSGYATNGDGGARLRLNMKALDPFGVLVNEDPASEVRPGPAGSSPVRSWVTVSLPTYAPPGPYRLEVTVTDLVGSRSVSTSSTFTVNAPPVEVSDSLALQRLRFTDGEDGPPRDSSSFASGSEIRLGFDIAGFKAGEGGHVKIGESLELLAEDGQKILEGHVLTIDERYFYVPRRIGASNHVKTGTIPAGEYRLRMTFDDEVGGQRRVEEVKLSLR